MEIPIEKKIRDFINNKLNPELALELITLIITDETTLKKYLYIKDELELMNSINSAEKLSDKEIKDFSNQFKQDQAKLLSHINKLKKQTKEYNKKRTSLTRSLLKRKGDRLKKKITKSNTNINNSINQLQEVEISLSPNSKQDYNFFNCSLNLKKL